MHSAIVSAPAAAKSRNALWHLIHVLSFGRRSDQLNAERACRNMRREQMPPKETNGRAVMLCARRWRACLRSLIPFCMHPAKPENINEGAHAEATAWLPDLQYKKQHAKMLHARSKLASARRCPENGNHRGALIQKRRLETNVVTTALLEAAM